MVNNKFSNMIHQSQFIAIQKYVSKRYTKNYMETHNNKSVLKSDNVSLLVSEYNMRIKIELSFFKLEI